MKKPLSGRTWEGDGCPFWPISTDFCAIVGTKVASAAGPRAGILGGASISHSILQLRNNSLWIFVKRMKYLLKIR